MKNCSVCGGEKELNQFNKSAESKSGYRSECRDCQKGSNKTYRTSRDGRLIRAFHVAKARAKRAGVTDELKIEELKTALKLAESRGCIYCNEALGDDFSVDHIIPYSKNGRNTFANIVLVHTTCNFSKHNRPVADYVDDEALDFLMRDTFMRSNHELKVAQIKHMFEIGEFKDDIQ